MPKKITPEFFEQKHTLDGAFGTLAIEWGNLPAGFSSERLNVENPELVKRIHGAYYRVGADIICANTFGANPLKDANFGEHVKAAVELARQAAPDAFIALDTGSSGITVGEGAVDFDAAVRAYEEFYAASDDYDLILIETMTDLKELRAALIGAKKAGRPVMCSMSFEENGYTFFGCSLESFVVTAEALGASAVGINCSLGSRKITPLAKRLQEVSPLPVFIKPNAGMPKTVNGKTIYDESSDEFEKAMREIASFGIAMLGGCCGTSPEYIRRVHRIERSCKIGGTFGGKLCCANRCVNAGSETLTVGERINPTGKPLLKRALADGDIDEVIRLGLKQKEDGADLLDVNVGINGIDETAVMKRCVDALSGVGLPLVIDSSKVETIEAALKAYDGKALVNSVSGKEESLDKVLPTAARYGAAVIGLCLDDGGVPSSAQERVKIAEKIIARAQSAGIRKEDIYIDTLTMAEGAGRGNANAAIEALETVRKKGVKTVLGVSNISFGMPDREDVNAAFYHRCKDAGLSLAIINPTLANIAATEVAYDFLSGREGAAKDYIAAKSGFVKTAAETETNANTDLKTAVINGLSATAAKAAKQLLEETEPLEIAEKFIVPALDEVGDGYGCGKLFLPQLIASADAAKSAMDVLSAAMGGRGDNGKRFVICTVKGDVHDIGKNIVKAVVKNYGYRVIDLGKDVSEEEVLAAVKKYYPCVLGLSALMTTTAENMARTIAFVRKEFPTLKILVGGAVLTESYAKSIGGTYCCDANDTVEKLKLCKW